MQIINSARKISVAEAASFLGVSKSWLDKHRVHGGGPAYLKIGRRVVYDVNDLEEFAAQRRFRNTSEGGACA
jgi:predicted DNA-binding transcriptional regulator AlpA